MKMISDFFINKRDWDLQIPNEEFVLKTGISPFVSTKKCFDDLFVPKDHVSRRPTDTYYKAEDICLRPHTSVH